VNDGQCKDQKAAKENPVDIKFDSDYL
jgi:hypothetical protein